MRNAEAFVEQLVRNTLSGREESLKKASELSPESNLWQARFRNAVVRKIGKFAAVAKNDGLKSVANAVRKGDSVSLAVAKTWDKNATMRKAAAAICTQIAESCKKRFVKRAALWGENRQPIRNLRDTGTYGVNPTNLGDAARQILNRDNVGPVRYRNLHPQQYVTMNSGDRNIWERSYKLNSTESDLRNLLSILQTQYGKDEGLRQFNAKLDALEKHQTQARTDALRNRYEQNLSDWDWGGRKSTGHQMRDIEQYLMTLDDASLVAQAKRLERGALGATYDTFAGLVGLPQKYKQQMNLAKRIQADRIDNPIAWFGDAKNPAVRQIPQELAVAKQQQQSTQQGQPLTGQGAGYRRYMFDINAPRLGSNRFKAYGRRLGLSTEPTQQPVRPVSPTPPHMQWQTPTPTPTPTVTKNNVK